MEPGLSGQYPEGRRTFEDILLTYPGTKLSDPIFWGIVKAYLGADEVEKAMLLYQRFFHTFWPPHGSSKAFMISGNIILGKRIHECRKHFSSIPEDLSREWTSRVGSFYAGRKPVQSKRLSRCDRCLSTGLGAKGRASLEPQVFSKLGYTHFYLKNYEVAIQYWEKLLADFPNLQEKNELLYWLAEASLLKQDYRKGVGFVDKLQGDATLYPKDWTV